jgi:mannosylglycerate hydrolase
MTARQTLTFVSHTHWDREWYQPFEAFRIRLVRMIDGLLDVLDHDPDYRYFMLDGQTIVLDDYLTIRPENEPRLREYVASGRLLIGPWYILPDEFLVSAESSVRNLLAGAAICARFGKRMDVGNIPDPFGHISQLPQILRGFDIDSAVFWRGVGEAPNEFTWVAPDGSDVLVIYQHDGYGNAASMPPDEEAFIQRTRQIVESLTPTATTPHLLAMNGSDHQEAMPELPRLLAAADAALPEVEIRHGTLPQFIEAVRSASPELQVRSGEMRDPSRAPLLPGVLSARMWIKQRNAACETLLTRWAEPMTAIAEVMGAPLAVQQQSALVRQAWRYLIQNHPHDSICGCSIDQVHREMAIRFDWVDQVGEAITTQCLEGLAAIVDTSSEEEGPAIVVFNPTTRPCTGAVTVQVSVPDEPSIMRLVSPDGQAVQPQVSGRRREVLWEFEMPVDEFRAIAEQRLPEAIDGQSMQAFRTRSEGTVVSVELQVARGLPTNEAAIEQGKAELEHALSGEQVEVVRLLIHRGMVATCTFVARDVPGLGYRTYWVRSSRGEEDRVAQEPSAPAIENEFLRVHADEDGTFTLVDKTTGTAFAGLNRFVDVGDRGDEYNFCPVEEDVVVSANEGEALVCLVENSPARQTLEMTTNYRIPAGLGEVRSQRSEEWVDLPITTRVSLIPGGHRVEVETVVDNQAEDHRLRVHFPVPVSVDSFETEGHLDVISRPVDLPAETEGWVEQPVPTHPQRTWTDASDGRVGLLVANRGLPEVEVLRTEGGCEIALTLLRCVGWLSRGDLSVRQGPAGPGLPTPEAQCIGEHTFHYALVPHSGGWQVAFDQAHAFNAPLRAVATYTHPGELPAEQSLIELSPDSWAISAIKEAEQGQGLIVRFWNTSDQPVEGTIKLWKRPKRVSRCTLGERITGPLQIDAGGRVRVSARGREIVTLLAEFDR